GFSPYILAPRRETDRSKRPTDQTTARYRRRTLPSKDEVPYPRRSIPEEAHPREEVPEALKTKFPRRSRSENRSPEAKVLQKVPSKFQQESSPSKKPQ